MFWPEKLSEKMKPVHKNQLGTPISCDWTCTALRQESLSVNWLTQMSCRPSWSGKPRAWTACAFSAGCTARCGSGLDGQPLTKGQGRGAAIIWKKARLQKFFNFTFCPTLWQLIWQGYWMRSQETCMWSQLVIRAKVCRMAYYLPGISLWFTHIVSLIPRSKSSRRALVLPFSFSN